MTDLPWKNSEEFYDMHAELVLKKGTYNAADFGDMPTRILRLAQLKPGDVAVDLGCGSGLLVDTMRKENVFCFGVSNSAANVAHAKKNFPESRFLKMDMLSVAAHGVDLVTAVESAGYVPWDSLVKVVATMLSIGGKFYCKDFIAYGHSPEAVQARDYAQRYWTYDFSRDPDEVIATAEAAGLRLAHLYDSRRGVSPDFVQSCAALPVPPQYPSTVQCVSAVEYLFVKESNV